MMFGNNPGTDETWKLIPEDSVGVELGVWKGDSSEKFLKRAKQVHLVDAWAPEAYEGSTEFGDYEAYLERYSKLTGEATPEAFQKYYDSIYNSVEKRFAQYDGSNHGTINRYTDKTATIWRMTTERFFWEFMDTIRDDPEDPVGYVDWVYVDASHEFKGCLRDLANAMLIVKEGGYIFGDDFGDAKPGVRDAVDYFARASMYEFNNFHDDQYYFVVDKQNKDEILKVIGDI